MGDGTGKHENDAEYRGLPYTSVKETAKLKTFPIRDDDIVVASYPRCGTHWLKEIVSCIMFDGDVEKVQTIPMNDRIPFITPLGDGIFGTNEEGNYWNALNNMKSPRPLSTHLRPFQLPEALKEKKNKILVNLRNPRDTIVSVYEYYNKQKFGPLVTWEEAFKFHVYKGEDHYGTWFDFANAWWEVKNEWNVKFVFYEDCHKDFEGYVKNIAKFWGKDLSDDSIAKIKGHTNFNFMKTNPNADILSILNVEHKDSFYMRKGIIGDWKNYFTVSQNEEFDKYYKERMKGIIFNEYEPKALGIN